MPLIVLAVLLGFVVVGDQPLCRNPSTSSYFDVRCDTSAVERAWMR